MRGPALVLTAGVLLVLPAAIAPAQEAEPVPVPDGPVQAPASCRSNAVKPQSMIIDCPEAETKLTKIKYSKYTRTIAQGTAVLNTCEPDCPGGKVRGFKVRFGLGEPGACSRGAQFKSVEVAFVKKRPKGVPKRFDGALNCTGD